MEITEKMIDHYHQEIAKIRSMRPKPPPIPKLTMKEKKGLIPEFIFRDQIQMKNEQTTHYIEWNQKLELAEIAKLKAEKLAKEKIEPPESEVNPNTHDGIDDMDEGDIHQETKVNKSLHIQNSVAYLVPNF